MMSGRAHAVVVHLGREQSMGAWKRVDTWTTLLEAAGASVTLLAILPRHGCHPPRLRLGDTGALLRGRTVPETQAWRLTSMLSELASLSPDLVICVTARTYHPAFTSIAPLCVLDYVDSLARSYRDRATITPSAMRRALFRGLGWTHGRFESAPPPGVRRVAAGWSDAQHLAAEWVPILAPTPSPVEGPVKDTDVLFFGNLSYPPNIEALEGLARIWPAVLRARPGTIATVAGARPTPMVRELSARHGWELIAGFDDLDALVGRARIACFPLQHTAGIQIKVLEAAALRLPQVVTPPALAGMAPGFPAAVAENDGGLVEAIAGLLEDETRREQQAAEARRYVRDLYGTEHWLPWATALVEEAAA